MTSRRPVLQKRSQRSARAVGLALILGASGLALAATAAEAGGSGGRGYRSYGSHGGSHGYRGSVGYRGHGRYHGSHRSFGSRHHGFGHRSFGSRHHGFGRHGFRHHGFGHHGFRTHGFRHHGHHGRSFGSHHFRGYPSRHYDYSQRHGSYRHYYPYKSYSRGLRYYPQPIYHQYPQSYGGAYVYNGAVVDPAGYPPEAQQYPVGQQAPGQPQPIYIVVQPPANAGAPPSPGAYAEPNPAPTYEMPGADRQPAPETYGESDDRPGQVFLSVEPPNAAVYLDDDLLGSGESLAELSEPLVLSAGVHVFEVIHPDHEPQRLFFGMPAAGRLRIDFDLDGDARGRKARMRSLDRVIVMPENR